MQDKKLDLCQNGKVSIRNDGITAKQTPMTLQEARLLRLVIMQISQYDDDLMSYETTIPELAVFLGITNTNTLYDDIFKICDKLTSQKIAIKTGSTKQPWSFQPWMSIASFDGSVLKLALNPTLRPYVMDFNTLFTQYEMHDILRLRSYYALRIYEILKMKYTSCLKKKNSFDFTIEELRDMTGTENKFAQTGHFRDKVLNIAEREINAKTDISVKIEEIKKSRRFIGFRFTVTEKAKTKQRKEPKQGLADKIETPIPGQIDLSGVYEIKALLESLNIPCSQTQAEKLFTAYDYDLARFKRNLDYVIQKCPDNPIAYLFSIKDEDIAPKADLPKPVKQEKTKSKKKNNDEPLSAERIQAYRDMEVDHVEDLWPDLPITED